jgi:hypothetical protein
MLLLSSRRHLARIWAFTRLEYKLVSHDNVMPYLGKVYLIARSCSRELTGPTLDTGV